MDDPITTQRNLVQRLYKERLRIDGEYIDACRQLAVMEALDEAEDEADDRVLHWHPPRPMLEAHWGEDA